MTADFAPRCTICSHPERTRIEHVMALGASKRSVAERFGVGASAAWRHFTKHLSPNLKAAITSNALKPGVEIEKLIVDEDQGALEHLRANRAKTLFMIDAALECGDRNGYAVLTGKLHENIRLASELTGRLQKWAPPSITNINTINIVQTQMFAELQSNLVTALAPFPDARHAVIKVFNELAQKELPPPSQTRPEGDNAAA